MWEKVPFKIIALAICLIIIAWALMSFTYPAPADAQDADRVNLKAIEIQQGILEHTGLEAVVFERYGTVSDNPNLVEQALSVREGFYVGIGEKQFYLTPEQLFADGIINRDRWNIDDWRPNAAAILKDVGPDWVVHKYFWSGLESTVFISPDGDKEAGLLVEISRVLLPRDTLPYLMFPEPPSKPARVLIEGCSAWLPVTHNILRRPAESIKACMDAVCEASVPNKCKLSALLEDKRWVTQTRLTPQTPYVADSDQHSCYQTINYEIDYFVGQINLQLFQFDVGKTLGGVLKSRLTCDRGVSLERISDTGK